jgi:glycosyltransferase involved in cell wall biosynthesis
MNILFVAPRYYPHVGGVEYVVKSVAERLAKKGYDVTVLCGESGINYPKEEWINNVHVWRWPVWSPGDAYHIPRMRGKLESWLLKTAKGCDVVHFHSVHSVLTIYCIETLKSCEILKVLTPHYHGTGHSLFRRVLWRNWKGRVKGALRYLNRVHTVSPFESELVFRDFNVKSIIIGHGVEEWLSEINWNPSDYVMYSGRIEKYKNIHRLANITKILNDEGLNVSLKIIGNGPYAQKLKRHLSKLKIKFEMLPPQPYDVYITNLSKAVCFGLLSEREAYGLTVNEANAIGVPAVVVEPWGLNFYGRNRTLITQLHKSDKEIVREIISFLVRVKEQPKPEIPVWDKVVSVYNEKLYAQK